MKQKIRIGCGAGFSGDRIEPAIVLAEKGELDYLVLECLAERTIALANKRKMADPTKGYDPLLERRIETLLPHLVKNNIRLITNMGAANPIEGAKKIIEIAQKQGIKIKVAAIYGDNILDNPTLTDDDFVKFGNEDFAVELIQKTSSPITINSSLISANAYLGVEGILEALQTDAQIIITGRVADPSLFLAPMIHEFGWKTDDYNLLGKGTVIGHLMECAGQITGGYFADPIKKTVENLENLGHPFADIFPDGSAIISKVEGTGGIINLQTAKEQLLYEVINPNEYYTPDVIADFTSVKLQEIAKNQVKMTGGGGKTKPKNYKVSVGYKAFWQGEGEISYAGSSALERAKLAGEIIEKRLKSQFDEIQVDYIGQNSIFPNSEFQYQNSEIRLRVAAKAKTQTEAALIGEEVEALYTNGPAGGGGVRKYVNEVIGIVSVLMDRNKVIPIVDYFES
ncbi:acyclic terpene utilization AtuA family protein [Arcicella sp. LKC2W]|uniref:acyclic terpene utilization AtuA family protein n=1 Tax=Arcicella sp. LKC2W TaxID=2984198 RepID=UPI002B21FEB1|nr:acyclic terpene utilization AtuA family protein [Arcicella sp. LKC2W]MEA5459482.1 acyclic terpene utilization AtuA family protein [Arcicella sp. LKC2W]